MDLFVHFYLIKTTKNYLNILNTFVNNEFEKIRKNSKKMIIIKIKIHKIKSLRQIKDRSDLFRCCNSI